MLGRDVLALVGFGIESCQIRGSAPIVKDSVRPIGTGYTRFSRDVTYVFRHEVGVKELVEHPDKDFSDVDTVAPIVALCHEVCGHGMQMKREFHKTTPLSKELMLNFCACQGLSAYYGLGPEGGYEGYFKQPFEIAAQYAGLVGARSLLTGKFGRQKTDAMLCKYVNSRIADQCEFIQTGKTYSRFDDILQDFDTAFKQQCLQPHALEKDLLEKPRRSDVPVTERNIAAIQSSESGLEQDVRLTYMFLRNFEAADTMLTRLDALRDMNLTWLTVFKQYLNLKQPVSAADIRKTSLAELDRLLPDTVERSNDDRDFGE